MAAHPLTETSNSESCQTESAAATPADFEDSKPSYVKLAMRNMVRKGGKSLFHFALTVTALLSFLIGLSYLTR